MTRTLQALLTVLALLSCSLHAQNYTGLTGFYDYQSNGGACKYIAVNPGNGHIHAVYMSSFDSSNIDASRRTFYAYSTNSGTTWNNSLNLMIPNRRSGFPSLDLVQTVSGYCPVIANQSLGAVGNCVSVHSDCPAGGGSFSEIFIPSPNVCLQWPQIACTSDSAIVLVGAGSVDGIDGTYAKRLDTTQTWTRLTPQNAGGRYVAAASATNRVSVLINLLGNGVLLFESSDNGRAWPTTPVTIYPPLRIVGPDTFQAYVGCDLTYIGDAPVAAIHEIMTNSNAPTDSSRILFWSQATGLVIAADKYHSTGVAPKLNRTQTRHMTMGYPVIGTAGPRIAIAYQAFMPETSMMGFNYSDIFYTQSVNGGSAWQPPHNLTATSTLDDRYPSISRWNEPTAPYFVYLSWQEDTQPGSSASGDNAPISRTKQRFLRLPLMVAGVEEHQQTPSTFLLEQNHPNPFNPSTTISYQLRRQNHVTLKVYDILGREVATLVNEELGPGKYEKTFDASKLASGIYVYRLSTGNSVESKKLVLLR